MTPLREPIYVYGYSDGCPACDHLKALLGLLGIPFTFHALDRNGPERAALRDAGFDTVPQAFTAGGLHIGDGSTFRRAAGLGVEAMML